MKKKKWMSMVLAASMVLGMAACGGTTGSGASDTKAGGNAAVSSDVQTEESSTAKKDFVTWEFYCQQASYQGLQSGWYGKILKDKLNIELNIISPIASGGGDSLYQTRSIAGNLGDIVVLDYGKMKDCVEAGLILDISKYLEGRDSINQYQTGIDNLKNYIGGDGVYAIPLGMSTESPTKIKLDNGMVNETTLLPWDYYVEAGSPELKNTDELLGLLKTMQENHPTSDISGGKTYAFSIFKDWDWKAMAMAERITLAYGFAQTTPSVFTNADCSRTQLITDDNGAYHDALKLLFKANQMGLVDPDSSAQDYNTMYQKVQNKEVLYVWYPWMATGFNASHKDTADGYAYIPVETQKIVTNGYNPYGSDNMCIGIGANAEDPERIMDYLEWSCTPEAINYYAQNIEGLTFEMVDGKPVKTEYGKTAGSDTAVPDEFGGGTVDSGAPKMQASIASKFDINPENGEPYDNTLWTSTLESERTKQDQEWTERFGYEYPQDYLEANNMVEVIPGNDYVAEEESTEMQNMRYQCQQAIINASWQMVFAADEASFDKIWSDMKTELDGLGFAQVSEADMAQVELIKAAREKAIAETK